MQADKCRTSSRSVKKELVIESPLRCKDAAQGEVEAESPGPLLVRGAGEEVWVPGCQSVNRCSLGTSCRLGHSVRPEGYQMWFCL